MLQAKYKAHRFINVIFYIIVFLIGFYMGIIGQKIGIKDIFQKILFIDNVQALEIGSYNNTVIDEQFVINKIRSTFPDIDLNIFKNIFVTYTPGDTQLTIKVFTDDYVNALSVNSQLNSGDTTYYGLRLSSTQNYYSLLYIFSSDTTTNIFDNVSTSTPHFILLGQPYYNGTVVYSNFDFNGIDAYDSTYNSKVNKLDFSNFFQLYLQLSSWNGYGYDFWNNLVGILDMRSDTYLVGQNSCPKNSEFISLYDNNVYDVCSWTYNKTLSDYLVFFWNTRIFDSTNLTYSNVVFYPNHKYTLSFTLYGLSPLEKLYSIQFGLEGNLTQEILSTTFNSNLSQNSGNKTYITFSFTPSETITFDQIYLKFSTNGAYANTIMSNRQWTYRDYTGLSDEEIGIIQTDTLIQQNKDLLNLIENPYSGVFTDDQFNYFWSAFTDHNYGLTTIVLSPLNAIDKIRNGVCTPQNISILGKNITLPCGDTLFWNRQDVQPFKTFWNMFAGGIFAYWIGISLFRLVHDYKHPTNDRVEVIDL